MMRIWQRNRLMTTWSIPTARNILHSRTRLDANVRMDESIVSSSCRFFFNFFVVQKSNATLCERYSYKNITRREKKAPGNNIFNLKNIYFIIKESTKRTLCGIVLFKLNTFFSHVFACP